MAVRLPRAGGVNVTLMVQVAAGLSVDPVQVSALGAKSLALLPATVTEEMMRSKLPALVTVSVRAGLEVPLS